MFRLVAGDRLVLATHNSDKASAFKQAALTFDLVMPMAKEFGLSAPDENPSSFTAAACDKALYVARATGLPAMADDSGFCVAALNGAPGVRSLEWAGPTGNYRLALDKLGARLGYCTPPDPLACFVSTIAVAWPDGSVDFEEGCSWGAVTWPPRGTGPDYDPVFQPEGSSLTAAELAETVGPRQSYRHRSAAIQTLLTRLMRDRYAA